MAQLPKENGTIFKQIYDEYHQKIYGYCLKLVNSYPVAQEITQDVFIRLWQKLDKIDTTYSVGSLLFKMTHDLILNHLKKKSRTENLKQQFIVEKTSSFAPSSESSLIFNDYLQIAEEAIKDLPAKRQKIFLMRYKEGLDNRQIAKEMKISQSTVRVHLMKATQFLRNYLEAHPEMLFAILLPFLLQ